MPFRRLDSTSEPLPLHRVITEIEMVVIALYDNFLRSYLFDSTLINILLFDTPPEGTLLQLFD